MVKKKHKYINLSEIAKKLRITSSNVSSRPSYNTLAILNACNDLISDLLGADFYSFTEGNVVGRFTWNNDEKMFEGIIKNTSIIFKGKNIPELHENFLKSIEIWQQNQSKKDE